MRYRTVASWLLVALAGSTLGGCVVAVIPVAAGGAIGRTALRRLGKGDVPVASETPAAETPAATVSAAPKVAASPAASTPAPPNAPVAPSPAPLAAAAPAAAGPTSASWYDVVKYMAKVGLRTSGPGATGVLPGATGAAMPCGKRPTAVVLSSAALGSDSFLYLGSLHTMGYEIVLTSRAAALTPATVRSLAKQGIAAPVPGKTLFARQSVADPATRAAIAGLYCVVGLVGARAGDFPGGALPDASDTRPGWFLIQPS